MTTDDTKRNYVTRDEILGLLSDDEVARVSSTEASGVLTRGEEYVDLIHLSQGVRQAQTSDSLSMEHFLPRKAVSEETWLKISSRLAGTG
jgi:hypothetical protein